jgi:hypothetical protein
MPVLRNPKTNRFVQVENEFLESDALSWRAKGMFCYLLSRPDGWKFNLADLKNRSPSEGLDAIKTAMKELEMAGYVAKHKVKSVSKGRWSGWEYLIRETPFPPRVDYPMSVGPISDDPPYINTVPISILSGINTEPERNQCLPPSQARSSDEVSLSHEETLDLTNRFFQTLKTDSGGEAHAPGREVTDSARATNCVTSVTFHRRLPKSHSRRCPGIAWIEEFCFHYTVPWAADEILSHFSNTRLRLHWGNIIDHEKFLVGFFDNFHFKP